MALVGNQFSVADLGRGRLACAMSREDNPAEWPAVNWWICPAGPIITLGQQSVGHQDGARLYGRLVGSNSHAGEMACGGRGCRSAVWDTIPPPLPSTGHHRIYASGLRNPRPPWVPAIRGAAAVSAAPENCGGCE